MNSHWCGTTDPGSLILGGLILLLAPIIALYFACLYLYCRLTGRVFLETEARELEESRKKPPIDLRRM